MQCGPCQKLAVEILLGRRSWQGFQSFPYATSYAKSVTRPSRQLSLYAVTFEQTQGRIADTDSVVGVAPGVALNAARVQAQYFMLQSHTYLWLLRA